MNRYKKRTGRALSIPEGLIYGVCMSIGITLAGISLAAKMIEGELLEESAIGYAVMIILLLASCAGAMIAQSKIKRRYLLVSSLSALIYAAVLLCITAIFFGGQYEAVGVTVLLILGGCTLAVLLKMGPGRGAKRRKRL